MHACAHAHSVRTQGNFKRYFSDLCSLGHSLIGIGQTQGMYRAYVFNPLRETIEVKVSGSPGTYPISGAFVTTMNSLFEVGGSWDDFDITGIRKWASVAFEEAAGPTETEARSASLGGCLKTLIGDESKADVTFVVDSTRVYLCKAVLASRSKYFENLFFGPMPTKGQVHVIDGVSADAFASLMHWVHTDEIGSLHDAAGLLRAANFYGFEKLEAAVTQLVIAKLDELTVIDHLILADSFSIGPLKAAAMQFISEHHFELVDQKAFQALANHSQLLIEIMEDVEVSGRRARKRARSPGY